MTPLEDAQAFVIGNCPPLEPIDVDFEQSRGLVLAADVVAAEQVPPFANSAVDGYAVRAADVATAPVELAVVAEVAAGAATDRVLGPGEAIRIMTGAPIPDGADAVVMVEDSERIGEGGVRIHRSVPSGARPECKSGFGVFDLTGNVDEWVRADQERPRQRARFAGMKGGAWGHVRNACRPVTTSHPPDFKYYFIGFRCCADLPP